MKPARNDPCPCGSGKKYKKCCQALPESNPAPTESKPGHQEIAALVSLFNQQRFGEAELVARSMTINFPRYGFGWKVMGAAANQLGRGADALAAMQKAAAFLPMDEEVHFNLGSTLHNLGMLEEAATSYRRALMIKSNYVEAHNNLGNVLKDIGRFDEARTCYLRALQIRPDYVEALCNLGNTLKDMGNMTDAEASLHRALQIRPDFIEALNSLAQLLDARGDSATAMNVIYHSLNLAETVESRSIFVACARHLQFTREDSGIRAAMVRAFTEPWGRPGELIRAGICLVKLNQDIGGCVARAVNAWPRRLSTHDLFGENGLSALATDSLLSAMLDATPICDIEMERFLTMARSTMIDAAVTGCNAQAGLSFYSALARQCFINEYLFTCTDDEMSRADELRKELAAALDAHAFIPDILLVAVAAYFPLCSIPFAERFLERQWTDEVASLLKQQVREPSEEKQLRASIPMLTGIDDEVSLLVQNQYEENPYPRWIKHDPAMRPSDVLAYLHHKFPLAPFGSHEKSGNIDVLVAGCGTGQHSIATAKRIQGAQVLAIDLSMSSLAYAMRKTRELGLTSIEYAQADLMRLGSTGRSFDVIESVGVLHHLADPFAGWQVLLSLLRPGGFMELGFYSAVARRNIELIWDFIAKRGYGSSANEIRRFRQDLIDSGKSGDFGAAINSEDFYSISTCRDLLFHVHEQRMTLAGIDAFLRMNDLKFLGFEIDPEVLHAYRSRFPDDMAASNLALWQIFENENPDTFSGMYHFWIQKTG